MVFATEEEYARVSNAYVVNNELLKSAKEDLKILHPLPRVRELDQEVDYDLKRAAYFRQMRFGLYVRAALLALVLS